VLCCIHIYIYLFSWLFIQGRQTLYHFHQLPPTYLVYTKTTSSFPLSYDVTFSSSAFLFCVLHSRSISLRNIVIERFLWADLLTQSLSLFHLVRFQRAVFIWHHCTGVVRVAWHSFSVSCSQLLKSMYVFWIDSSSVKPGYHWNSWSRPYGIEFLLPTLSIYHPGYRTYRDVPNCLYPCKNYIPPWWYHLNIFHLAFSPQKGFWSWRTF